MNKEIQEAMVAWEDGSGSEEQAKLLARYAYEVMQRTGEVVDWAAEELETCTDGGMDLVNLRPQLLQRGLAAQYIRGDEGVKLVKVPSKG